MIPKIVHYCWLSSDPIPDKLQKYINSWQERLPDYKFMLWNLNMFDINTSEWVRQAYGARKYAFAADYIRLYALCKYGGIYLDSDVEVIKSFDPLLELKTFICWQRDIGGLEMAVVGAEKGAEWVQICLSYYKNRKFIDYNGDQDTLPLPTRAERNLQEANYILKNVYSIDEAKSVTGNNVIPVFPYSFFSPKSYLTGKIEITDNTFAIHHFAGSWLSEKDLYVLRLQNKFSIFPFTVRSYISKFLGYFKYDGFLNAFKEVVKWFTKKNKPIINNILFYTDKYIFNYIWAIFARCKNKNYTFSIISNNCWGGGIYQDLKIKYYSPTVGLFFYPDDYIMFLKDLKHNMEAPVEFVEKSKYGQANRFRENEHYYPIGVIDGKIEIHFLHYKTQEEALEKWIKRASRVNFDNLYIKMDDRDGCTLENIIEFDSLPYKNKIIFTSKEYAGIASQIVLPKCKGQKCVGELYGHKYLWRNTFNVVQWLNS